MNSELKVLFPSPEIVPFAKTGGLADVAGSLPSALKRLGADIRLILPFYRVVKEGNFEISPTIKRLEVYLGEKRIEADVRRTHLPGGTPVYLIEREDLYDRPNLYGNSEGDYYDNLERFSFFSHAVLKLIEALSFRPDVIHCHDWQTGLIPALIKGPYKDDPVISDIPTLFTIHNIGYQGTFSPKKLLDTGLPQDEFFHLEGLEFWGNISLLKAGVIYSEAVTTVSPTYAREIQTQKYGMGMEEILRRRRGSLYGILNGIDDRIWNPSRDPHITAGYSPRDMAGKGRCKEALIREMGIEPSLLNKPLFGMVSRLDIQKGIDLVLEVMDDLVALDVGIVVLGSGDEGIQEALEKLEKRHPGRIGLTVGFNEALAHRIMAGVDILLIPSRYEPCGLTQMYALNYGTVPVVRATGGLNDTVVPFDQDREEGNGFKFGPSNAESFMAAIQRAVDLFNVPDAWTKITANGMSVDFSWDRSARRYLEIYESIRKR